MDPNSQHQIWSLWTWNVEPPADRFRPFLEVRDNIARFARKAFGTPTQLRLTYKAPGWIVEIRTEGHPIQEPDYVEHLAERFRTFFRNGFGAESQIRLTTKLLAGAADDGRPAEQLIILPVLERDRNGESALQYFQTRLIK